MKLQSPIKRLNLTLTPDDHFLIKAAMAHSMFATRSDIIREALNLLSQLRKAASSGVRVVLRNEAEREQYPVSLFPAAQIGEREAGSATAPAVEVRLQNADAVELEWLKSNSPKETQVEIIRQALAVYADVVEKMSTGWRLLLSSKEGSMFECPVRGIQRGNEPTKASGTTDVWDEQPVEPCRDMGQRGLLPARLLDAVADSAKTQGTTPEALITDIVREYVSKAKCRAEDKLRVGPHTIENLIDVHQEWSGESLLVAINTILDADEFFAVLLDHLRERVKLFYVTPDREGRERIETRLKKLAWGASKDVERCLHWINVPSNHFSHHPQVVIFDPLSESKACGYVWLEGANPSACYNLLDGQDLANALREYAPCLIDVQKQHAVLSQEPLGNTDSEQPQTHKPYEE